MWLQTGAGRRGRGGYQGGWCTGAWGGAGPVLPAAVASFICIRREVIDGKVVELKGNVYFVLCVFCFVYNTQRCTHTKAYVPYPYHWGAFSLLVAKNAMTKRAAFALQVCEQTSVFKYTVTLKGGKKIFKVC